MFSAQDVIKTAVKLGWTWEETARLNDGALNTTDNYDYYWEVKGSMEKKESNNGH